MLLTCLGRQNVMQIAAADWHERQLVGQQDMPKKSFLGPAQLLDSPIYFCLCNLDGVDGRA
jgi:hypothetical protein